MVVMHLHSKYLLACLRFNAVPSLSEPSGKLQLAETTGELSSTNNIVVGLPVYTGTEQWCQVP